MPDPEPSLRLRDLPLTVTSRWGPIHHAYGWTANIAADAPFAVLLMVDAGGTTLWARTPSADSVDLELRVEPIGDDPDSVRVSLSAPGRAYVAPLVVRLHEKMPVPAPPQRQAGTAARLLRPVSIASDPPLHVGLLVFAKSDLVMRRNRVWGLKPKFLVHFSSPFREVLEKGRAGSFETGEE